MLLVRRQRRDAVMSVRGEMPPFLVDTFGHAEPPFVGDPGTKANECCGHDIKPLPRVTGMVSPRCVDGERNPGRQWTWPTPSDLAG